VHEGPRSYSHHLAPSRDPHLPPPALQRKPSPLILDAQAVRPAIAAGTFSARRLSTHPGVQASLGGQGYEQGMAKGGART
jgi:hypothetical protein